MKNETFENYLFTLFFSLFRDKVLFFKYLHNCEIEKNK
jgi:hypothetical protein